uniref:Uncharacterized protein n=1 Tax=Acrobeloides nanus TaxID=290746 RepID=A0A914CWS8_9BILA
MAIFGKILCLVWLVYLIATTLTSASKPVVYNSTIKISLHKREASDLKNSMIAKRSRKLSPHLLRKHRVKPNAFCLFSALHCYPKRGLVYIRHRN